MKTLILDHEHTPEQLSAINKRILELLDDKSETESDLKEFSDIIALRDEYIREHLSQLSIENKNLFAKNELSVNNLLNEMAQSLLKIAKEDVSQFLKKQTAVKKYK